MITIPYKKTLIIFLILANSIIANSQQQSDSLLQYLEIAAKNNPSVLQKFSEYKAALQKVPQAGSLSDPELSLGLFLSPMELVNGNQVADIRLMQMFPWFGVLRSAKDEMSMMANAKYELFRDARLQVYYDVQRTWYELYRIQKNISISEKNIEILKRIERLALVSFSTSSNSNGAVSGNASMPSNSTPGNSSGAAGMQSMGTDQGSSGSSQATQGSSVSGSMGSGNSNSGLADLYLIQIEAGDLGNNIELLKSQKTTLMVQFNSYLNRSQLTPVTIPETMSPDSLHYSLISVSDSMILNNPMLSMLQYEKQSIEARKNMLTGMGYPMVGLGLNYSLIGSNSSTMADPAMNGKDMVMPMITVTLPIYRKKYIAMRAETDYLRTATLQNYQATANSLQNEYYQAVQLYNDSQRRIKLYDNQSQLAAKSFDLMLQKFAVSGADMSSLLRVQQQTLDYEVKKAEAVADFNTALAWLQRLMALLQTE